MSNWIGDSGNWTTAGEWDAGVPDSTHDAIFNAGSFSTTGLTVTVDATATCKDLSFVGATNSPTLALGTNYIQLYGNITTIAAMSTTYTSGYGIAAKGSGTNTVTTNGLTWNMQLTLGSSYSGTLSFGGNFTSTAAIAYYTGGNINTNNKNLTISAFSKTSATAGTFTLGSSTITLTTWDYSGSGLTIPANTATINCSGSFAGGGITTYHIVNLTGATSTVSGNNTFNTLALPSGTTGTYTITDGSTQSAKTFTLSGDAKHTHTITGTATAGYTLTATGGGTVYMDYVNMSYCTATGATFLYGPHCTMTSCTGWKPAPRYSYFSGGRI